MALIFISLMTKGVECLFYVLIAIHISSVVEWSNILPVFNLNFSFLIFNFFGCVGSSLQHVCFL